MVKISVEEIKNELKSLVEKINTSEKAKKFLNKWIGKYYGRIISWRLKTDQGISYFYITFKKDGAKFFGGYYPSPDMCWVLPIELWHDLYTGKKTAKELMLSSDFRIWGNMDIWTTFHKLRQTVES